ncbi:hypothetical protein [uncultured Metabacillus sp.]|uniref:hypothetical protein n=1 Tax=uncultured Metabacillus sp. TaxID=2860135 RepID=UPI002612241F|nr:hypothetical protein [uncultured Metabacillus sp.]
MIKKLISPLLLFLLFLMGCQSQSTTENKIVSEEQLLNEAKEVYEAIKNNDESALDMASEFSNSYIETDDYDAYDHLLVDMDKLINSYKFYHVALGLDETKDAEELKARMNTALSSLEEKFNK